MTAPPQTIIASTWLSPLSCSLVVTLSLLVITSLWALRSKRHNRTLNQRNQELKRQNLELIKSNNVKHNFLASMSHEIRNSLNGILGIAQLLQEKTSKNLAEEERINHLYTCAHHLHRLMGQMLDYSNLESGILKAREISFDSNELIQEVVNTYVSLAKQKNLTLTAQLPSISNSWLGDPILFKQILICLIANSVKYSESGEIRLTVLVDDHTTSVTTHITIEDPGTNILPRPQNEGIQVPNTASELRESLRLENDLGLTVAQQLTELINGQLSIDTKVSSNTKFEFTATFPTGDPIKRKTRSPFPAQDQLLKGAKVLVADDMDFNRYINKELLTKMGAIVDEADNGKAALEKLQAKNYSLAILDINMPLMSGIEVVSAYSKQNPSNSPTLIALSAFVTSEAESLCKDVGFNHFIEKPLDQTKLARILRKTKHKSTEPKKTESKNLLSYLANNNPQEAEALKQRFKAAFLKELNQLFAAIEAQSDDATRASLHKLTGLSNLRREEVVADWLNQLSEGRRTMETTTQLSICSQIEAHFNQL